MDRNGLLVPSQEPFLPPQGARDRRPSTIGRAGPPPSLREAMLEPWTIILRTVVSARPHTVSKVTSVARRDLGRWTLRAYNGPASITGLGRKRYGCVRGAGAQLQFGTFSIWCFQPNVRRVAWRTKLCVPSVRRKYATRPRPRSEPMGPLMP